jgi:hypothetical protein
LVGVEVKKEVNKRKDSTILPAGLKMLVEVGEKMLGPAWLEERTAQVRSRRSGLEWREQLKQLQVVPGKAGVETRLKK